MADKIVKIFTDGGCKGNPGPGGWGAVMTYKETRKTLSGYEAFTTNNRMELTAAIKGLEALSRKCQVIITTDSKYLRDGITGWIKKWKKNGWMTEKKEPVKNIDLWVELDMLINKHDVEWRWVKGHNGHPENELADHLANKAMTEFNDTIQKSISKQMSFF